MHPVTQYAIDVLAGAIVAGPYVRLACQRHINDLGRRDIYFDEDEANNAITFFEQFLVLETGHPFILEPWQKFIVGSLTGWKNDQGYRRFRVFYGEIGKGNGKTPLAAGLALYALAVESYTEPGVEIYMAATTRDQAGICYRDARIMIENSPALTRRIDVNYYQAQNAATHSFLKPISSDARRKDGARVHLAVLDELHEHPNALMVQKLRAGVKGRRNALIVEITNSGYDPSSICYQHHKLCVDILEGRSENDTWFAYICSLDTKATSPDGEDDDWRDENCWVKANPNIGVSISYEYLREQVAEARQIPSNENIVKRLNFCIWTESATHWIRKEVWDQSIGPIPWERMAEVLRGRIAIMGIDLSNTTDITAVVVIIQDEDADDETYYIIPTFWCPEHVIRENGQKGGPYEGWVLQGALKSTEGNVIDYDDIEAEIGEIASTFEIEELAYDPWNAVQLVLKLEKSGLNVYPVRQGFPSLNGPTKKVEELITDKRLLHGGHPVLSWMASNTMIVTDAAGNKKPAKDKSVGKIDGISALITGMARSMLVEAQDSEYEERELLVIG